ncbi:MAG: DUF1062 domain-containing protein [Geminicoccales bacterium]
MSGLLRVRWTVIPKDAPQPLIACNRCGCYKPFQSSGKFRQNAQGKRLDAWLIYKCTSCQNTWNCPVLERLNIREIDPALMQALQSNDQALAKFLAFDIERLRRHAQQVNECADTDVRKELVSKPARPWSALEIVMVVPFRVSSRTDRLLASELGLSRAHIRSLERNDFLRLTQPENSPIRRPVKDQMHVYIDLLRVIGGLDVGMTAAGFPTDTASDAL